MDKIEKHIMAIYKDVKKQLPKLHNLSFEVTTYEHSGETNLHGFIHIGKKCKQFDSISDLKAFTILYRNFKGIL